jgi:hypothetical protein
MHFLFVNAWGDTRRIMTFWWELCPSKIKLKKKKTLVIFYSEVAIVNTGFTLCKEILHRESWEPTAIGHWWVSLFSYITTIPAT